MKKKVFRIVGIISLVVGVFLIVFPGIISIWGDFEALSFNSTIRTDKTLSTLKCPVVITSKQNSTVSASFYNLADKSVDMEIRTYVTDGYVILMKQYISKFTFAPDESITISVPITPDDAAYERVVMVRMQQMSRRPFPSRSASCGIVVVNVPFLSGTQFVSLIISLGFIMTVGGITLYAFNARPINEYHLRVIRSLVYFTILSFLLTLTGMLGLWLLGLIIIILWIVMGIGIVAYFALIPKKISP